MTCQHIPAVPVTGPAAGSVPVRAAQVIRGATGHDHDRHQPAERIAQTDPAFSGVVFTPQDFRRLFGTELVNNGLPIHIGAALLGHLSLETTRGYVAIFDDEVVRHYQGFLHRRRAERPAEEYKQVADGEWQEFEELRPVQGRTRQLCPPLRNRMPARARLRCPVLHVDPGMVARLDEIETDLLARRSRAEAEGWLGEIEGIDLTLKFLRDKRNQAERAATFTGVPSIRQRRES